MVRKVLRNERGTAALLREMLYDPATGEPALWVCCIGAGRGGAGLCGRRCARWGLIAWA